MTDMADERFVVETLEWHDDTVVERYGIADGRASAVSMMESRIKERPNLRSRDSVRQFLEGESDGAHVSTDIPSIANRWNGVRLLAIIAKAT